MPARDIRWRTTGRDGRRWLILDGEVTRFYIMPGWTHLPYTLRERLPTPDGRWASRQVPRCRGYATLADLERWIDRVHPPLA